jgi:proline dehydrogenase
MRAFFLYLARKEGFKNFALNFKFFRKTASRFIAGETLDDAIRVIRHASQRNIRSTLDLLGENTQSRADAGRTSEELIRTQGRIHQEEANCNLSVKLTQLGLKLDPEFCEQNLIRIAKYAKDLGTFIRVDMEDSSCTDRTLEIVDRVYGLLNNVGAVIQAYLYRSEHDIIRMNPKGIRIRLVKGAYREPESIAYRRKKDTDANFVKLMKMLLQSGNYPAIATHDVSIIRTAKEFAQSKRIPKDAFEFQMLYGIRRDLQHQLAREGYNVRLYIPYGSHWYPYFMRRLAERPANVAFLVRNLFMEKRFKEKRDHT